MKKESGKGKATGVARDRFRRLTRAGENGAERGFPVYEEGRGKKATNWKREHARESI